ncbi:MAG: cation transporter [Ruminiclostridium sp.]|nr:cation transporter [Ruminiclostridium sp.]
MIKLLAKLFIKDYDNYSDPAVRTQYGVLAGIVGIVMNFLLFAGKLAAGLISSSVSVVADAFNNLSDAGSAVISIAGYHIAAMPADKEHPFGHGRAEYVAGLIVSCSIIFMALEIGKESFSKIFAPDELSAGTAAFIVLGASILVKLYIFFYNRRIGRLINSAPMKAVAIDSLSDCISTLSAIAALVVYAVWNVNIDGYIGLLITVIILKAGIEAAKESLAPLLGEKADDSYIEGIRETANSFSGIIGVHDLHVHNYGVGRNVVSLHAEIPAEMSFIEAHEIADALENELSAKYGALVTVHMDPSADDNERSAEYKALIAELLKEVSPEATMHDFRMTERDSGTVLVFDIEVPFGLALGDDEIKARIADGLRARYPSVSAIICVDKKIY